EQPLDTLVIDTAAGISGNVTTFAQAAQDVIVVVCNEPASMTDAYALIKVLARDRGLKRAQILANMVRNAAEGREVYENLRRVTDRFLDVTLGYLGAIPQDDLLKRAVQRQCAVVEAYPNSPAAVAFRRVAQSVGQWAPPQGAHGNLEFFVERQVA